MNKADIEKNCVIGKIELIEVDEAVKVEIQKYSLKKDPRPWRIIFEQMEELLQELDWDSFKGLQDDVLREKVKTQADYKYLDIWSLDPRKTT